MLIDSHCHLDRLDLARHDGDLGKALKVAHSRGVEEMLCVGINLQSFPRVLEIAENYPGIYASVGVHPSESRQETLTAATLVNLAHHPKVVAIGETGLDYSYGSDSTEMQKERFCIHLQAARLAGKAVIIHSRDAVDDTLHILDEHLCPGSGGVLHCFTESWDMAQHALKLGLYISISGIVTFKNAAALREVVKKIPLHRLLIETDSPYLAPTPYRGKPNEPAYLPEVAAAVAAVKGLTVAELGEITTTNFRRLFGLPLVTTT